MRVSSQDRASLDEHILALAKLGDELTIDDFRTASIENAKRTAKMVRRIVAAGSIGFLFLTLAILFAQIWLQGENPAASMLSAALWSLALGGLGAIASIFLHLLKLVPQQTFNTSDEFEVIGRIVLGCLFSTIISITLISNVQDFFAALESLHPASKPTAGPLALLPFLLGYSIPLVLRILEKIIHAVELTIGAEDKRITTRGTQATRRSPRRSA